MVGQNLNVTVLVLLWLQPGNFVAWLFAIIIQDLVSALRSIAHTCSPAISRVTMSCMRLSGLSTSIFQSLTLSAECDILLQVIVLLV